MSTWSRPARRAGLSLAVALAAGACSTPTSVSSLCIAPEYDLVFVRGVVYAASGDLPDDFTPGDEYATVLKLQGCEDVVVLTGVESNDRPDNTLDEGDSNYLPAGTRLYVVPGTSPTNALAVRRQGEGWHAVVPFSLLN